MRRLFFLVAVGTASRLGRSCYLLNAGEPARDRLYSTNALWACAASSVSAVPIDAFDGEFSVRS